MESKKNLLLTRLSIAVSSVAAIAASGTWTNASSGDWSTTANYISQTFTFIHPIPQSFV